MESLGWVGDDVWFAHSVHVNEAEIGVYASTGCGVAHCPILEHAPGLGQCARAAHAARPG